MPGNSPGVKSYAKKPDLLILSGQYFDQSTFEAPSKQHI
jgi:hypothetical protein